MTSFLTFPLRFAPYLRPMVWGGRRLVRFVGKALPTAEPYGESWEVSDHALHASRLATASSFGVTLRELMAQYRDDLLGPAGERHHVFPWLIKLLDAHDNLSVQVHPDDEAVQRLWPGESGKTEAWYVLEAAPGSRIWAGLKPGVGARELRAALEAGTVADCLHSFTPAPGDFVFIPAGTVHALGGGILLAEIQQTSDATFRLFDWNRRDAAGQPRPLNVEQALASIHWDAGPIEPIRADDKKHRLVICTYFEIERFNAAETFRLAGQGRMQAWMVVAGHGRFANGEFFLPGDVWILPSAMPAMTVQPDCPVAGLLCSLNH
ncbi:MAG: class I mannose-6-phosphate isomerase [Planctomycetes bacterium]|nr:class I mannose-6-phosphate isomerase [Planctomycetota bacterium]